jgi:hypothetical protein
MRFGTRVSGGDVGVAQDNKSGQKWFLGQVGGSTSASPPELNNWCCDWGGPNSGASLAGDVDRRLVCVGGLMAKCFFDGRRLGSHFAPSLFRYIAGVDVSLQVGYMSCHESVQRSTTYQC